MDHFYLRNSAISQLQFEDYNYNNNSQQHGILSLTFSSQVYAFQ